MATKITAGRLTEIVEFEIVIERPDGHGGFDRDVETIATPAHILYLRGGETVQASRLSGKQPVVVTVRRYSQTLRVTTDATMRNKREGTRYNIRAIVPTENRAYLEITAESGVAT